jgi:hypothetical protein
MTALVTTRYSEKRQADRHFMVTEIEKLCQAWGFKCETEGERNRAIRLEISTDRGLRVAIEFDGRSPQPDVHVVCWHTLGSKARLAPAFGPLAGGDVNPHHFGKCTAVQYGWEGLYNSLQQCFAAIKSGEAFQ